VLNVTSTKKKDVMIGGNTFPPLPTNVGGITVTADTPAIILWNATARSLATTPTSGFEIPSKPQRTRSDVFVVGLKEKITVSTSSSEAWRWRRIVFTHKGILPGWEDTDLLRTFYQIDDGTGVLDYQRTAVPLPFALVSELYEFVFRGLGVNNTSATPRDWIDPITAPVDTQRVQVLYDSVKRITSGNDTGIVNTYSMWHGVGKNLHYGDFEVGGGITSSPLSTTSKPGCGDVYVMDLIFGNSDGAENTLDWTPTSTLYWHEK